jgi:predicted Fe-Mo cluster-binding NifX family protein
MKIAVCSNQDNIESLVSDKFGRCEYFLIFDVDEDNNIVKSESIKNQGNMQDHGAGVKSAEQIGNLNIDVLIVGNIGPNVENVKENFDFNEIKKEHKGEIVFFPLLENNEKDSRISDHFGHAPFFGVYDVQKNELKIIENNLDHLDMNKSPIDQIQEKVNPTIIFAKGIGRRAINIIEEKGLKLRTGNYLTVGEAIENLNDLDDQVSDCGH